MKATDQEALQSFEFAEFASGEKVLHQDENGNLSICYTIDKREDAPIDLTLEDILHLAAVIENHTGVLRAL